MDNDFHNNINSLQGAKVKKIKQNKTCYKIYRFDLANQVLIQKSDNFPKTTKQCELK